MAEQEKIVRRQRKAAVTRHLGNLERLIAEENAEGVRAKLEKLSTSFNEFEAAHDVYHDTLETDQEINTSETWFEDVQSTYISKVKAANAWLKSRIKTTHVKDEAQDDDDETSSVTDLVNLLAIPKVELDKFDGNPLEYQTFIAIFDEVVDSKISDCQVKLTRLLQYTSGSAKSSIKNCALIGGETGYAQARDILQNRYGNSHLVSQRIIADLKGGKSVSKAQDLQQLADELSMALTALQKLGMYAELNTQQSIIDILQRCQPYIRRRWRKKALDQKKDKDSYPSFQEFVEFITLLASEACDPVYGSEAGKSNASTRGVSFYTVTNQGSERSEGYAVNMRQNSSPSQGHQASPCVVCNQRHRLFYCDKFKAMPVRNRVEVVNKHRLCYNCLLAGHGSRDCRKRSVCSVPGCGRKHTKFIHVDGNVTNVDQSSDSHVTDDNAISESNHVNVSSNVNVNAVFSSVYLPVVPVVVGGQAEVYALLDTGSTSTFITERLATRMKLKGSEVSFKMNTLANSSDVCSKVVKFNITSVDGKEKLNLDNVLVVSNIPARYPHHMIDVQMYPHLAGLPIKQVDRDSQVDILIGMDNAHALMPLEVRCCTTQRNQPYATRTLLGWSLNGPVEGQQVREVTSQFVNLEQQVEKLWEMETLDEDKQAMSYEDRRVIDLWNREMEYKDGHYVLPVPWRDGRPNFPNNRLVASHRLKNLVNRLQKSGMLAKYAENIQKMINDGYAEEVPEADLSIQDGTVWYLPHHAVISEAKPGKVRVVFDCAAKKGDVSLNNQCFQGPDLNNKLIHVLLRFRQHQYAVVADVEAMYHQVKIPVSDRNSLRFLWVKGDSVIEYRMTSHLFGGVWCSSSSTFALRQTVQDSPTSELVRETVCRSFYVDDLLKSLKTREDAAKVIVETKKVLKHGGFNLTKFVVNDTQLLQEIDEKDRAKEVKEIPSEIHSKALGIKWDVIDDCFYYTSKYTEAQGEVTKRLMLSQLSSMYDPLGLISPVILQGKMLFQESTRLHLSWDAPVPSELAKKWSDWLVSLKSVPELRFPRCVIPEEFDDGATELHHFCDASESGYGACSYLRSINRQGKVYVALLASKSRLAPIKKVTIPRLELSAAVVAVKLDRVIRRELDESLNLTQSTFWSDSQIALAYIQSDSRRFKVFVANRVSLIREYSSPDQWHHISGVENPADMLSRGCSAKSFLPVWFHGPPFLSDYKSSWRVTSPSLLHALEGDPEVKQSTVVINVHAEKIFAHPLEVLINHYSSFYRLKKALCWILRLRRRLQGDKSDQSGHISVNELNAAQDLLIKHVQKVKYVNEISALQQGKSVSKSSTLYKLTPVLLNGRLVVGGRLKHASIPGETKHPVILPQSHKLSQMIIEFQTIKNFMNQHTLVLNGP